MAKQLIWSQVDFNGWISDDNFLCWKNQVLDAWNVSTNWETWKWIGAYKKINKLFDTNSQIVWITSQHIFLYNWKILNLSWTQVADQGWTINSVVETKKQDWSYIAYFQTVNDLRTYDWNALATPTNWAWLWSNRYWSPMYAQLWEKIYMTDWDRTVRTFNTFTNASKASALKLYYRINSFNYFRNYMKIYTTNRLYNWDTATDAPEIDFDMQGYNPFSAYTLGSWDYMLELDTNLISKGILHMPWVYSVDLEANASLIRRLYKNPINFLPSLAQYFRFPMVYKNWILYIGWYWEVWMIGTNNSLTAKWVWKLELQDTSWNKLFEPVSSLFVTNDLYIWTSNTWGWKVFKIENVSDNTNTLISWKTFWTWGFVTAQVYNWLTSQTNQSYELVVWLSEIKENQKVKIFYQINNELKPDWTKKWTEVWSLDYSESLSEKFFFKQDWNYISFKFEITWTTTTPLVYDIALYAEPIEWHK